MGLRAITVAVDYADLLAVTLPYNRAHFSDVMVVTDDRCCYDVQRICDPLGVKVYATQRFYEGKADFNKWSALEAGLDVFGRTGWITLLDADVLWPKSVTIAEIPKTTTAMFGMTLTCRTRTRKTETGWTWSVLPFVKGCLYCPRRRMLADPLRHVRDGHFIVPPEETWATFPPHPNEAEFAGYSQIFSCDDPVLGSPPWHATDYTHAGTADSLFQDKWDKKNKIRPPFECLHIGCAGVNWFGRTSDYLDGTRPPDAAKKLAKLAAIWKGRRGKSGLDRFSHEKIGGG